MSLLRCALNLLLLVALVVPQAPPAAATPTESDAPSASLGAPGVSPKRIKIGVHAPFTGASPIPASSVEEGADLFFRWLEHKGVKIDGRYIDVVIKNDNYNPSQAVAVCREMVEQESVFLLVGIAGPHQIQACGRYAASVNVPYISWGATETGMQSLQRYFATSMSPEQQAPLVADLLIDKHSAKDQKNAVIWTNTPSDQAVRDRFVAAMEKRDAPIHLDRAVPKTAGGAEAETVAAQMKAAEIDNAFFLGRTTFWIQLENAADNKGLNVQWASVYPTFGTDDVVGILCRQGGNGLKAAMLSPVPAFGDRSKFDRRHDKAMQAIHGERGDDTTWRGWAMGRNIAEMFRVSPRELTRRSFSRSVTDATIETGITPKLPYGRGGSFVARKTHLLRADCEARRWKTTRTFVSDF